MFHTMVASMEGGGPKGRGTYFFLLWILWLAIGTLFYSLAKHSDLGFAKGFYMAVNVGYSIGFGYPTEPYDDYLWFSTVYVLIGSSFVAVALGFFADKISEDHDNWFTNLMQQQQYERNMAESKSPFVLMKSFFIQYEAPIRALLVWAVWVGVMITYSIWGLHWPYIHAQYFAISTLSTGGLWGLPEHAPEWMFGVTAFMAMLGVPLMAVAMAQVATMLVDQGDLEATKAQIIEDVTGEELLMLRKFGLENGDGVIDSAEFIILCMVRMGQDPQLIEFIANRFKELDDDDSGYLTIEEITGGKYYLKNGQIVAKSGETLGVKGMAQFSTKNLNVELSERSGSRNDDD